MRTITAILFTLLSSQAYTQSKRACTLHLHTFRLDHEPNMEYLIDSYDFYINRQHVVRSNETFSFQTNYPGLDTIYMSNNEGDDTVITRFRPGHTYAFTIGAGMAGFTVYEMKKTKNRYPPVKMEIQNLPERDTVVGFYCDLYGAAVGRYLVKNGASLFAQPYKFTNEDGLAWIAVGKLSHPLIQRELTGNAPKISHPEVLITDTENIVVLARVHVCFMHKEKVSAVYDARTQKLNLEVK